MVYFQKTQPSPECLNTERGKASGDYKCGDVLTKIKNDFKNKCYICEYKEPVTINVEHFRPHKGDKTLKLSWDNLFWSCGHCNNIKLDNFVDIIDCTDLNEDIENRIKISMKTFPMEKVKIESLDDKSSTISTKELLNSVYNGTTKLKTIESSNLRNKTLIDITDFQKHLQDFYLDSYDEESQDYSLSKIKRHLKKSSNFTAVKRSIIRDNETMNEEFSKYFD